MDMTSIAAAQASIKALLGLAKGATAAVVDHELKAKLIDIQGAILEAQSKLGDAQAERLNLLEELAELRTQVRKLEEGQNKLAGYSLAEVSPGTFLYEAITKTSNEVEHYACPTCYSQGTVAVIQQRRTGREQVTYSCQRCKFTLIIGKSDPLPPIGSTSAWGRRDW